VNYQINMKYYMKTGITEFGITGVRTRDAGTSEFSNLKTGTLEFGITGGFPIKMSRIYKLLILCLKEVFKGSEFLAFMTKGSLIKMGL
jgi:hypothetical protein